MGSKTFLEENDLVNQLNEFDWKRMEAQERLSLLQRFENYLADSCGREACKIRLIPKEELEEQEEGSILYGYYDQEDNCIYINPRFLTSRITTPGISQFHLGAALTLVAHEGRHAWQHYVVKHPEKHIVSPKDLASLTMNNDVYVGGMGSSFILYTAQIMEYDARHFANSVMKQLSQKIEETNGHPSYIFYRTLKENETIEKHYAQLILSYLDAAQLKQLEEDVKNIFVRMYPDLDFSEASIFEAAIRLLETNNVKEFIDDSGIHIKAIKSFQESTDNRKAELHLSEELKAKEPEIELRIKKIGDRIGIKKKRF